MRAIWEINMLTLRTNGENLIPADKSNLYYKKDFHHYERYDGPAWNMIAPSYVYYNENNCLEICSDEMIVNKKPGKPEDFAFILLNNRYNKIYKIDLI